MNATVAPDMVWPAEPVDLAEAARMFKAAGDPVDRSNLSRFVSSRQFAHKLDGKRVLVDARKLWDAYQQDYSRQIYSAHQKATRIAAPGSDGLTSQSDARPGDGGGREASHSATAAKPYDPKREETQLKVVERRLDLAQRLRKSVPVEEVAAASAEAIALLVAAAAQNVADEADRMVQELNLPAHKLGQVRTGLKRLARKMREAFAQRLAEVGADPASLDGAALERQNKLVALALELRGETEDDAALEAEGPSS